MIMNKLLIAWRDDGTVTGQSLWIDGPYVLRKVLIYNTAAMAYLFFLYHNPLFLMGGVGGRGEPQPGPLPYT